MSDDRDRYKAYADTIYRQMDPEHQHRADLGLRYIAAGYTATPGWPLIFRRGDEAHAFDDVESARAWLETLPLSSREH